MVTLQKNISALVIHEQGPGGPGGRSTRALSMKKMMNISGCSVIDLGCKEGYNSFDLFECGCRPVLGVDIRDEFLNQAKAMRRTLTYEEVNFCKADVRIIDEAGFGKFDICLCTGLLYHMQNPFNLLKRIRNICSVLFLETHIAPSLFHFFRTKMKYRRYLSLRTHRVCLDDEVFSGRYNQFPVEQDMMKTSGSIDSHNTFWPDKSSLLKMLNLAGFSCEMVYFHSVPSGQQPILVRHGLQRTKIWIMARVVD